MRRRLPFNALRIKRTVIYSALWERGRLDLTVEAMILDNARWHPLFSDDELTACERRLLDYGYVKRHP